MARSSGDRCFGPSTARTSVQSMYKYKVHNWKYVWIGLVNSGETKGTFRPIGVATVTIEGPAAECATNERPRRVA